MPSSRKALDRALKTYRIGTVPLFATLADLGEKNVERLLGLYRRDEQVRTLPYVGKRKLYTLTARGAKRLGLDPRKHRRAPMFQTIANDLLIATFCAEHKQQLLLPSEFAEMLPDLAALPGYTRRYFIDTDGTLSLIVPDFGMRARELARRARGAVNERKERFDAWKKLIYPRAFRIYVVTPYGERKAKLIEKHLSIDTFPHVVARVRLEELFPARSK